MQAQTVLGESLRQHRQHPLCVLFLLEEQRGIIRKADFKRPSPKPWLDLVLEPDIEHFVQVEIAERGRHHAPYAKDNFQFERRVEGWRKLSLLDLRRK